MLALKTAQSKWCQCSHTHVCSCIFQLISSPVSQGSVRNEVATVSFCWTGWEILHLVCYRCCWCVNGSKSLSQSCVCLAEPPSKCSSMEAMKKTPGRCRRQRMRAGSIFPLLQQDCTVFIFNTPGGKLTGRKWLQASLFSVQNSASWQAALCSMCSQPNLCCVSGPG